MTIIILICAAILLVSALMLIWRIGRGPTTLDRVVSIDMVSSVLIGAFALLAVVTRRSDLLPVFVVLALVGFVGSTTVARFARPIDPEQRRLLTREEERRMDLETYRRALMNHAPVHDVDTDDTQPHAGGKR